MGITQWVQTKLNPAPADPIQARMFGLMPIMFTFMFATFPAGLVIYYTWNNLLGVAQQWYIMSRQGVEVHLFKNLRLDTVAATPDAAAPNRPRRVSTEDDDAARKLAAARKLFAGACDFVWGTGDIDSLPPQSLPEIAFVGRSNAGKSSLINALTNRKTLARVSHTPGRTREINFFKLGERLMLADLPGYGYAKASKTMTAEWQKLIFAYLRGRASLRRVSLADRCAARRAAIWIAK